MNNSIANINEVEVWIVKETTPGVLVYPSPSNAVLAYDLEYPSQTPEFEDSKERARSRDVLDRCQNQMPAGEWGFKTSCRPDGAGQEPAEHVLLESLAGKSTTTASTNIIYEPNLTKPSFSLWVLTGHTMFFCTGATVGQASLLLESCPLEWEWSGMFMKLGIVGTDGLDALVAASDTVWQVKNTDKFDVGGKVALKDNTGVVVDDNGGAGYTIDSIQTDTSITVASGALVGVAVTGEVVPFNPGHSTPGNKLETRTAVMTLAGTQKGVADFSFQVTDEPEYLARERTPSGYPESYVEKRREVGGEIRLIFREDDAEFFQKAREADKMTLALQVGDTTGYQVLLECPSIQMDMPSLEEVDPLIESAVNYTALAVTGEDSFKITYK